MNLHRLKELANKYPLLYAALYPAIMIRRPFMKLKWRFQQDVIKNLNDLLIEDPVVKIDEFNGIFAIDTRSDLFARVIISKEYEPRLVNICKQFVDKDKDVIDVGANVGFYSVLFAKDLDKGRVLAVEPTQNVLKRLRKNILLNNVSSKIEIFEGVVSNTLGHLEIKTIRGKEEYSSIGVMGHPVVSDLEYVTEKVTSITLDELVKSKSLNPGFIKIDVEGAENLVFAGAQKVLREKRPVIMAEISDFLLRKNGSSAEEVFKLLKDCGYDIMDVGNPAGHVGKDEFEHILCTPKEKNVRLDLKVR